jgi:hypothetical protein
MIRKKYREIVAHYERCLDEFGDTHRGVDWPNLADAETRYAVMLDVIRPGGPAPVRLLDFGCGASHLQDYILRRRVSDIEYAGLDVSEKFVQVSKRKFPSTRYYCVDVLEEDAWPTFDYIVMNGVFTVKRALSFDEMLDYLTRVLRKVFAHARIGIAFNVMSTHVDWERDDLFHLPQGLLTNFVADALSRRFVIRQDYGLYEYTTYVYRTGRDATVSPVAAPSIAPLT